MKERGHMSERITDETRARVRLAERLRGIRLKDTDHFGFYALGKAVWEALGGDVELCDAPRLLAELIDPITDTDFEAPWQVCRECHCKFAGYNIKPVRFCPHCGSRLRREIA